jgi:serine/threonine protein kinase
LERAVAIKVLSSRRCADLETKERFEREAKTISSLNHPNICHLYDVGEQDEINFLVMEYLEGETLAQRLHKGPLAMNDILNAAVALADARTVAHTATVIHRNFKSANLFLTHRNEVKILDFGLAKNAVTMGGPAVADEATLTIPPQLTMAGTALGTVSVYVNWRKTI